MLLDNGAVVDERTSKGETDIYAAAGKAHKDVVAMFLRRGAILAVQEKVDIVPKLMDPNNQ
jgi:ankyrin repeat protein